MRNARKFISILILLGLGLGSVGPWPALASDSPDPNDARSAVDRDPDGIPSYERAPSRWSVGFRMAQDAFPFNSAIGQTFQITGDWILPFQKWGLFSLGGHFGSFPIRANGTTIPYAVYENGIGGLDFRYQLKYAPFALFVPTAGITLEYYRIRQETTSLNQLTGINFGLNVGLMINLGALDTVTSRDAYQSISLTRAYLTFEVQTVNLNSSTISLSGNFYFMGIRTEFK